jgi:hypothetical protein
LGRKYSLADGTHINLAISSLVMGEKARDEPQPLDLEIDDIDGSSQIVIEDSFSVTFMERDYATLTPMGLITEIFVTFSCKVKGEAKKVRMDVPHFLVIYKKARRRGIRIKKGKDCVHLEKDGSGKQKENRDFDILDFIEKCIAREKDGVGDMFF